MLLLRRWVEEEWMDWLMHNRIQPLIAPLCKECSILIFVGVTLIMNGMMFTHWALPDVTHMPSRRALPEATLKPDRAWKRHFIDRTRPIPSRVRTALYSLHSWLCIGTSDWARGVALLLEWVSIPDCWAWLTSAGYCLFRGGSRRWYRSGIWCFPQWS